MVFEVVPPGSAISLPSALSISTYERHSLAAERHSPAAEKHSVRKFPEMSRMIQNPVEKVLELLAPARVD